MIGGPQGDCGLTGRKIIVDTYGGACPHGGGAFPARTRPTATARLPNAARYVAINFVAAGLARQCQIQVSYAIGVAKPISITIYTEGTGAISDEKSPSWCIGISICGPRALCKCSTCCVRFIGRRQLTGIWAREPEFTRERTDKAAILRADARL